MIILTKYENNKRVALDPGNIFFVIENESYTLVNYRVSSVIQSDAGVMFCKVTETFDEVMAVIEDHTGITNAR